MNLKKLGIFASAASTLALGACIPTNSDEIANHVNRDDLKNENGRCNFGNDMISIQNQYGSIIAAGRVTETVGTVAIIGNLKMNPYDPYGTDEENDWRSISPLAQRDFVTTTTEAAIDTATGNCVIAFESANGKEIIRIAYGEGFETHPEVTELSGYLSYRVANGEPAP